MDPVEDETEESKMPRKINEREYRRIEAADLITRKADDGKMTVEGYATIFNQPYELYDDGEYRLLEEIDRNAFGETDMRDVILQYDHEGRVFARTGNGTLEVLPDEKGLKIRARLDGTEIGRQLFEEIEGGYTTKMSFGFTVARDERKTERDQVAKKTTVTRKITGIRKLYDVSAVSLPANDATEISARNLSEGVIAQIAEEFRAEEERKREIAIAEALLAMAGA